jgi:hypothetical protein
MTMSDQDLQETLEAMAKVVAEVTTSKSKALAFLVEAGINTPTGELTEPYKQSA